MTATQNIRTDRAYRGVVYGYVLLDHHTHELRIDYIGQTRQRGRGRDLQHRDDKPWADLILGDPVVLWEGDCTGKELDDRESWFIKNHEPRPRMNWRCNEDNPEQIPKWVQLEQRHERDDRLGRPRWQPPEKRVRSSLLEWDTAPPAPRRPARRRWTSRQKGLLGWGVAWAVLAIGGWIAEYAYPSDVSWWACPAAAGGLCVALWVWLWLGRPIKPRTWRRRVRRKLPGWLK